MTEAAIAIAAPAAPPLTRAERERMLVLKLEREGRRRRRAWALDPALWALERLGARLWSGQARIMRLVAANRKIAIATCHEIGKSFSAALLAAWWIDVNDPCKAAVVTTAPTSNQVKAILWKEIGRAHGLGRLPGRINVGACEWLMVNPATGKEEIVGMGRKPSDYTPDAFQGIHAERILVIGDEANGIADSLHPSLDSLAGNDLSKKLLVGNPDNPRGEFAAAAVPGSGYAFMSLSAFDSPNFTGEEVDPALARQLIGRQYVEECRAKWAPAWRWAEDGRSVGPPAGGRPEDTHPFWQSKILGRFPVQSGDGSLIPLAWIRDAQARELAPDPAEDELGLDVGASKDGDPSCLGRRRGDVFRVLWEQREPDTMKTTGRLLLALGETGASLAKVDYIGVGRGVVDRCREQGKPVHPISVGEASTILVCLQCRRQWDDEGGRGRCPSCNSKEHRRPFADLLSQLWWDVRTRFETGEIDLDPADEDLAGELVTLRWEPTSKGQIKVRYADGPSPNRADALLMSFAPPPRASLDAAMAGLESGATW